MLNLVYTSSYGVETEYFRTLIGALTEEGKRCFLFVPESSVLKSEQQMFSVLDPSANLCFEVLSFKRLSNRLQREYGGLKNSFVSEQGKIVLTSLALKECMPILTKYSSLAENDDFIRSLAEQIAKLKSFTFTPEMLSDASAKARSMHLTATADKLSDISAVYSAYDSLLHKELQDSGDRLIYAAKQLENEDFFKDSYVFFDGFSGFTPAEYAIIKEIMKNASELYFAVFSNENEKSEVFEKPLATADTLKRLAGKCSLPVALPVRLAENKQSADLELIRTSLWDSESTGAVSENVSIYACDGISGEAETAASVVLNLCREHGYNMKDIAICAADGESYEGILDAVFSKHGIPLFMSLKSNFSEFPLCKLVYASLQAVHNGYKCEDMLGVLGSSLTNVPEHLARSLEIYAGTWRISGGLWQTDKDFTFNPDGYAEGVSSRAERILNDANKAKRLLAAPLYDLAQKLEIGECARDHAASLYEYLSELKVEEKLDKLSGFSKESGDVFLAELQKKLYDGFIKLLEECAQLCTDKGMSSRRFEKLLVLAMKNLSLQIIPTSIDEVQLLSPSALFGNKPKALIILGASQGVFPSSDKEDSFFTKAELRAFESLGLDLGADKEDFCCEGLREFYTAASLPSEKLFVLYDKTKPPSIGVHRLESLFSKTESFCPPLALVGVQALADAYAESSDEKLGELLKEKAPSLYEHTEKTVFFTNETIDPAVAKKAIGYSYSISPSAVEEYCKCKLSCWCKRILRLRTEKSTELAALDIGNYVHKIFERFINERILSGKGFSDISKDDIVRCAKEGAEEYIKSIFCGLDDKSAKFKYLVARLSANIIMFMRNMAEELKQSKFVPWKTELCIGSGTGFPGLCVSLEDGASISVNGKTDRVDIYKTDDKSYVRVIDYKSGSKSFSIENAKKGFDLQMLMYLFSLCKSTDEDGRALVPAGVIYSLSKKNIIDKSDLNAVSDEDIMKNYTPSGVFLADLDVLRAMDRELSGRFIPIKPKKDGSINSKNVLSADEFNELEAALEAILKDIGTGLREGNAAARPNKELQKVPCTYCDFKNICRYESDTDDEDEE